MFPPPPARSQYSVLIRVRLVLRPHPEELPPGRERALAHRERQRVDGELIGVAVRVPPGIHDDLPHSARVLERRLRGEAPGLDGRLRPEGVGGLGGVHEVVLPQALLPEPALEERGAVDAEVGEAVRLQRRDVPGVVGVEDGLEVLDEVHKVAILQGWVRAEGGVAGERSVVQRRHEEVPGVDSDGGAVRVVHVQPLLAEQLQRRVLLGVRAELLLPQPLAVDQDEPHPELRVLQHAVHEAQDRQGAAREVAGEAVEHDVEPQRLGVVEAQPQGAPLPHVVPLEVLRRHRAPEVVPLREERHRGGGGTEVLEGGGRGEGGLKGGGGGCLAGTPPPPSVPLWSPPRRAENFLKLRSSWHRRRRSKNLLSASNITRGGGRGGGGPRGGRGGGSGEVPPLLLRWTALRTHLWGGEFRL